MTHLKLKLPGLSFPNNGSRLSLYGVSLWWVASVFSPHPHSIKHGRLFQHRRKNKKRDLRSPDKDVLDLTLFPIGARFGHVLQNTIHVVLRFVEKSAVHVAILAFNRDDGSFAIVHEDDGDTNAAFSSHRHLTEPCAAERTVAAVQSAQRGKP